MVITCRRVTTARSPELLLSGDFHQRLLLAVGCSHQGDGDVSQGLV